MKYVFRLGERGNPHREEGKTFGEDSGSQEFSRCFIILANKAIIENVKCELCFSFFFLFFSFFFFLFSFSFSLVKTTMTWLVRNEETWARRAAVHNPDNERRGTSK